MIDQPQEQSAATNPAAESTDGEAQEVERDETDQHPRRPQTPPPDLDEREASARVERDLDELGAARRERDEYLELAQRTRADFENYRKRVARETSEALSRGKADLARDLLPVIDNLERALGSSSTDSEALAKGVALVLDELRAKLGAAGVEAYDPAGERFDPSVHEAISTQPREGTEAGLVIETVEKGYRLNGQVLRPARVVVSE
jgi:molecular chaperone GrpE